MNTNVYDPSARLGAISAAAQCPGSSTSALGKWQFTAAALNMLQLSHPVQAGRPAFQADARETFEIARDKDAPLLGLVLRVQADGWSWKHLPRKKDARRAVAPVEPQPQGHASSASSHASPMYEKVWYLTGSRYLLSGVFYKVDTFRPNGLSL